MLPAPPDPTILSSFLGGISLVTLAGSLPAEWGGALSESLLTKVGGPKGIKDALVMRQGNFPRNHDLLKAARRALANSLLLLHQSLEKQPKSKLTNAEQKWIGRFHTFTDRLARDCDKEDLPSEAAQTLQRFDELFKPTPNFFAQLTRAGRAHTREVETASETLAGHFHETVEEWLVKEIDLPDGLPSCLGEFLHVGFQYKIPDAPSVKNLFSRAKSGEGLDVTLFQLWSMCFFEGLKGGQRDFCAYLLGAVIDLSDNVDGLQELKSLLGKDGEAFLPEIQKQLETNVAALARLETQIAALTELTRERFAEVSEELRLISSMAQGQHFQLTLALRGVEELRGGMKAAISSLDGLHDKFDDLPSLPLRALANEREKSRSQGTDVSISDLEYRKRWLPELLFRDEEMDGLGAILDRPEPFLWHAIVGEGGVGKSRLAQEFASLASQAGWRVGFLRAKHGAETLALKHDYDKWKPTSHTLIVVDYASLHRDHLPALMDALSDSLREHNRRLRLLLLDRPNAIAPIFNPLSFGSGSSDSMRTNARAASARDAESHENYVESRDACYLEPLAPNRWDAFLRETMSRASKPGVVLPETPEFYKGMARITDNGRPLLLQLLGLALAQHPNPAALDLSGQDRDHLLDLMLQNEVHFRWQRHLTKDPDGEQKSPFLETLQRAVALITLCRGLDIKTHKEAARTAIGSLKEADAALFGALRHILLPRLAPDGNPKALWHPPLEPDLFGERFVVRGGYLEPEEGEEFGGAAFDATELELMRAAVSLAPNGVTEFLGFALQDYPAEAAPLLAAAIPHVPASTIDLAAEGANEEGFLTSASEASAIVNLWAATSALARSGLPLATAGVQEAFLAWGLQGSETHRIVSLEGALQVRADLTTILINNLWVRADWTCDAKLTEWVNIGPDEVIFELAAPLNQRSVSFTRWLAFGCLGALRTCGERAEWARFDVWGDALREAAKIFPNDKDIQLVLSQGAYDAVLFCAERSQWERYYVWGNVMRETGIVKRRNGWGD